MDRILTKVTDKTDQKMERIDFGVRDRMGRAIGAMIVTWTETYVELPADSPHGYLIAPGTYLVLQVQATRVGQAYGASQPSKRFGVEQARLNEIERYTNYAKKAAARKAGK